MSRIEFVSPLSLGECVARLDELSDPPGLFGYSQNATVVDIFPHDENTRFYRISKGFSWSLVAAVEGALVDSQQVRTIVTAETNIPKRWYAIYGILAVFSLLVLSSMSISGNSDGFLCLILWAVACIGSWFIVINRRHQKLISLVEKTLR